MKESRLSLERIEQASSIIDPAFLNTPQYFSESISARLGCKIVVKVETVNPIRSFKGRGTEYFTSTLREKHPIVCATAGNFGQGMAYSARKQGIPITIFTANNANPLKVERMRALGAEVRQQGFDFDAAHDHAVEFAEQTGALLVEDGRERAITEGAGTIGVELMKWPEPFDAILVPLGDGALLAGVGRWVKAHRKETEMMGVCAAGADAMERSWRAGRVIAMQSVQTIADGIAVRVPFQEALADLTDVTDEILRVEDERFIEAMRLAHAELGVVLEPAGAAGLAAILSNRDRFKGKLVCVILTGGNVSEEQMRLLGGAGLH